MAGNVAFKPVDQFPPGLVGGYQQENRKLSVPRVGGFAGIPLAVVGGGPSLEDHLEDLRNWDGDIWAINATWGWLQARGVDAWFYTIDPSDIITEWAQGALKAVLGDTCKPELFDQIPYVEMAELGPGKVTACCSSITTAPMIAATKGYSSVTFFGGDGSFLEKTHVDRDESAIRDLIWIECGGEEFKTTPGMAMQTERLAEMIRALPGYLSSKSGGFLSALVREGDFALTHVNSAIHEKINKDSEE